jgi:serine/threonine protein kinase
MIQEATCPDPGRLDELLHNRLPERQQAELVGHLDACMSCQLALEELATGGEPLTPVGDAEASPPSDSAFWPALREVENQVTGTQHHPHQSLPDSRELSLDFLSPSESPEYLGRLAHFEVVEVIGRGGMGIVLRAFDPCLERHVALKVLDPEMARDEMARKRFCREARAAAAVTHENVVAIHQVEIEETRDLPFLVMQIVTGESLEERLERQGPLDLQEILRIGAQTAHGLAAAHAQGLIHRDVKPANILLEKQFDRVRITDFGLARAVEDVKLTQTGFVAGTPLYMAPEQARGEPLDHRTDLFSLGSVLYAMCTGKPPFTGSTPYAVLRQVTDDPPPPIRESNPSIPDWLVEVVERLHAKKPEERFQSAAEVAELLSLRLAQLSTEKAPKKQGRSGARGRSSSQSSRGRMGPWLPFAVGVLAGALGMFVVAVAPRLIWPGPLAAVLPGEGSGKENLPPPLATLTGNAGPIWSVAFDPNGNALAVGLDDGTVKIWDLEAGRVRATLNAHAGPVWSLALTSDGGRLATASDDGTVKLWDTAALRDPKVLKPEAGVRTLAFAPDGKTLLTGARNGKVSILDLDTGKESVTTKGHNGVVVAVAFSSDGKTAASASGDKTVKLWDAATGQEQVTLQGHQGGVYGVAFAPDGKTVATGSWDHTVRVWDASTGNQQVVFNGHSQDVWAVAFSPDGRTLASAGEDRTVKLWDLGAGKEVATFKGHTGTLYTVAFSPKGDRIASGGRDGTVRLWSRPE